MPTYNRGYIIERAIKSVLNQTYSDWELVIIDDASTDDTQKVVNPYISSKVRYYVNATNKGANASRNLGAEHAKGELLMFLDSDNYWPKERIEKQVKCWNQYNGEKCFFYAKVEIKDDNCVNVVPKEIVASEELKQLELMGNVIDTNGMAIEKRLFHMVGGFDETMPRLQDWEFILRLLYIYDFAGIGVDEIYSYNEIQENSIGKDKSKWIIAIEILFKKYMCEYLTENELVNSLLQIKRNEYISYEEFRMLVTRIAIHKPELLDEAITCLQKPEQISCLPPYEILCPMSKIILYGAGVVGKSFKNALNISDYAEVVEWIDKKFDNQQKLTELRDDEYDYVLVAVLDEMIAQEIMQELIEKGIPKEKIVWKKVRMLYKERC